MKPAAAVLLGLALLAAACSGGGAPAQDPGAGASDQPTLFTVPKAQLQQLRLVQVRPISWTAEIRTTGTVDWDADHTTQVIAQASGPISRIVVDIGRRVKAGDPLLYVSSPDLAAAISAYKKAANRLDLARRALERNLDLLKHKAIAQKDFESTQADFNDAYTDVQNALQTLRIFGVSDDSIKEAQQQDVPIPAELALRSPLAGVVVQKLVLPGQLVQSGTTPCFLVSNITTVWVQGHLHDNELSSVRVGDTVEVRSQAAPTPFPGKVTNIGALLDPATRTTPVRVTTANRGGLLKKDQFVDLVLQTSAARNALTVPTSAVLYTDENFPFVYRQVEPGRFARAVIRLGAQHGDAFEVLSGVSDGDTVVAEGGVFLQFAETAGR